MKFTDKDILILLGLALCIPMFFLTMKADDVVNHVIISRLFAEQFLSGDIYPRWLFGAEDSFGSPALYFFPPLHYYITLIFYPLKYLDPILGFNYGYLALYCSAALSMALSGFTSYKCLRLYADKTKAFAGAIFYLTSTYHLLDLYHRFAFSELWAFVFMPLCVYYIKKNSFTKLVLSFAALILVHMFTVLMFTPVLIALIFLEKRYNLLLAMILGALLTIFYWLPGMDYQALTFDQNGMGIYSIKNNFLRLREPIFLIPALPIIAIIILVTRPIFKQKNYEYVFWLAVSFVSIFMSCSPSAFIWDLLPPLGKVSFPWRFMIVGTLASSILLTKLPRKLYIALIIFSFLLGSHDLFEKSHDDPDKYLNYNMLSLDTFRSKWTPESLTTSKEGLATAKQLQQINFDGVTTIIKTREILVTSTKTGLVTIPQFYFPNWQTSYDIWPDPATGLIQLNLPKPATFTIKFTRSPIEKISLVISFLTLLLILKNRFPLILRKSR